MTAKYKATLECMGDILETATSYDFDSIVRHADRKDPIYLLEKPWKWEPEYEAMRAAEASK